MHMQDVAFGFAALNLACAVLPSPRFSCEIGLVLDLFRGGEIAVALAGCGFFGLPFMHMLLFFG